MLKVFLPVYLVLFYGLAFFWRSYQTWRKTGANPYRLQKQDSIHGLAGRVYRLVSLAVVIVVLFYVFWDGMYAYLAPIRWLEVPWLAGGGVLLLSGALILILIAQVHMGDAWRIGVDLANPADLVTHGVFGISRNPIFMGVRLELLGLFLVLPNAVTLGLWLLGDVMIRVQVYLEEDYLGEQHGDAYRQYCRRVRRWL